MKKLIAAIMAAAVLPVSAEVVATAAKKGGGEIVITDLQGKCPSGSKVAFARDPGGRTVFGCWTTQGYYILIAYNDGDFLTYDMAGFIMTEKYRIKGDTKL